jgi:predicted amidohydrolase YtcJ
MMTFSGNTVPNEIRLINGKIATMDKKNSIVSSITIKNGRITGVGNDSREPGSDSKVIDLQGRLVIPGLIDNHMHFLRTALLPGHDMRELETAFSIDEALEVISAKARKAKGGEFLSALGGILPSQFKENRFPTLAEMDEAAPDNPVYLSISSFGPGATNSPAKEFLLDKGVTAGDDGTVGMGPETVNAWKAVSTLQSFEGTKLRTRNQMAFAVSVGLTTVFDNGGTIKEGGWLDPVTGYDPLKELLAEQDVILRVRLLLPVLDREPDLPQLRAQMANNLMIPENDMVRIIGLGEWLIPQDLQRQKVLPAFYEDSVRLVAENGLIYMQHMISLEEQKAHLDVWEKVDKDIPLRDLHWTMDHAYGMDKETLDRAKAMGIGIGAHSTPYLADRPMPTCIPPFRMILDSGIRAGGGSDGARISTMNPWPMIYYMVTGKSCAGELINPGQTITRMEALRLWTAAQGWFSKEEDKLGSLEVGKLADLVVLSDDFLDEDVIPDDAIRTISSVMTIVDGKIVHDAGILVEI